MYKMHFDTVDYNNVRYDNYIEYVLLFFMSGLFAPEGVRLK